MTAQINQIKNLINQQDAYDANLIPFLQKSGLIRSEILERTLHLWCSSRLG